MNRSQDFRFVFANTFKLTYLGNEAQIVFAIQQSPADPPEKAEQQFGVVLTPTGLKSLTQTLGLLIEDIESATGAVIPLDPSVLAPVQAALAEARARRAAAQKALPST
jgi:hypothetical protein